MFFNRASWISWPLAFMIQEVVDEVSSEVPFRYNNFLFGIPVSGFMICFLAYRSIG